MTNYNTTYYSKNREHALAAMKVWRANNPDAVKNSQENWRRNNEGHTYLTPDGYVRYIGYNHPAANPSGITGYHRIVLWDKLNGENAYCYWGCGTFLYWSKGNGWPDALFVDHVNTIKHDNRPENLVPTCHKCNVSRENGQNRRNASLEGVDCHLTYCDRPAETRWELNPVCKTHYQQAYMGRPYSPIRVYKEAKINKKGRTCTACDEFKSWDNFYKRTRGGYQQRCKPCMVRLAQENKEKRLAENKPCSVEGCDKPAVTKGMCQADYHKNWYATRKESSEG